MTKNRNQTGENCGKKEDRLDEYCLSTSSTNREEKHNETKIRRAGCSLCTPEKLSHAFAISISLA